jgi:cytochrome c553
VLLVLLSAVVAAADPTPCLDCHRSGASQGLAPLLEGQHAEYLRIQLTRFREHLRPSFPMTDLSQGLDAPLIDALATTLSARPWEGFSGRINREAAARGAELGRLRDCRACHGEAMRGTGSIPRLAGQAPAYLRQQLEAFVAGDRYHPPTGGGQRMQALSAQQSEDLAYWLASLSAPAGSR